MRKLIVRNNPALMAAIAEELGEPGILVIDDPLNPDMVAAQEAFDQNMHRQLTDKLQYGNDILMGLDFSYDEPRPGPDTKPAGNPTWKPPIFHQHQQHSKRYKK